MESSKKMGWMKALESKFGNEEKLISLAKKVAEGSEITTKMSKKTKNKFDDLINEVNDNKKQSRNRPNKRGDL